MPENSLHSRAWPWFVGAALVYGGTVIGAWWPRTGPPEVNLIPFQPHVQALRRGARTPEAQGAWRDLAINVVLLMPTAVLLTQGFRRTCRMRGAVGPTVALGCVGSLVIEVGQVVIPGRVPDATDVVLNSLGVALSSALVARWDARRTGRDTHDSGGRRRPGGATGGHDAAACGAGCALHVVGATGGPSWLD